MKISNEMINQIKEFEGCEKTAYLDSKGVPTIGIGHTGADVSIGDIISDDEVIRLFRKDIAVAEKEANKLNNILMEKTKGTGGLDQNQFDAIVDLVYNAGASAINPSSTMYRLLVAGGRNNTVQICHAFMLWVKCTINGKKVVLGGSDGKHGLVLRRAITSAWYVYGPEWKRALVERKIYDVVEWAKG